MPTQLGLGSGLGSSRMSLECKTERALGLAQAGEPAQLSSALFESHVGSRRGSAH